MSYRQPIFQAGAVYRVLKSLTSTNCAFLHGEELVFTKDYYSVYDSCFVYAFKNAAHGEEKEWWLPHDDDPNQWHALFEPVTCA